MTNAQFAEGIPKAELHLHIEGSFEPEHMFSLAKRNNVSIKYNSIEDLKKAYQFNNLQDFLDVYYAAASVLIHENDFYELTMAYLKKVHTQNVKHVEIFFDAQTHTSRGIAFETVFFGIKSALEESYKKFGIQYKIILCFLRHLSEEDAMKTLEMALPFKEDIYGVGLDSSELGFPPSLFEKVFEKARQEGFVTVAHAGEEGPAAYVWEAINLLKIARLDHGNNALDDDKLVAYLVSHKIALTVCPLSNIYLKVVKNINLHPLKKMMDRGLLVTINSDDPAYFGGYINENYLAMTAALDLSKKDIYELAKNSFIASFLNEEDKEKFLLMVELYYKEFGDE